MVRQGVLNGIDTALWDPATDPLIPAPFAPERPEGKALCKRCGVLAPSAHTKEPSSVPPVLQP